MRFEPVGEVQLAQAPLVAVLAQVRYPSTPELLTDDAEQELAAMLPQYPVRTVERGIGMVLLPSHQQKPFINRVFSDVDETRKVVIAEDFVAVTTSAYTSRKDFLEEVRVALGALARVKVPPRVDRVGVRYVDQLTGEHLTNLPKLVHREMLGALTGDGPLPEQQSLQAAFSVSGKQVVLRTLLMPPRAAYDPTVPVVDEVSWLLDIDASDSTRARFDVGQLAQTADELAEMCHSAFRGVVTDEFLTAFK